ncbi:GNAT family N-acetyltransferase [Clostridium polynesiense]|uniref:GNAT family N-acetyltransferase n=1 Tax=Clostridium polynesiense TaxID=1325933 RepID=UPI00058FBEC6|nr:GNAT family N-acetyltransferase [Clostridium polynesiense]
MADIILKAIEITDGKELLKMIREIGPGENGFENRYYDMPEGFFEYFKEDRIKESKGIGLNRGYVKQSYYVLYHNSKPVGLSKLRHSLTPLLFKKGGHIGYSIRPTERGKGYGNIILKETLNKAKELGIRKVLITCKEDNLYSKRIIEKNGGRIEDVVEGICRYWIKQ